MPKKAKNGHWILPITRNGVPMELGKPDLAWMSIGYALQLPPIYTLAFYNGIANNGRMMKPRFVTRELSDGQVVREFPPVVFKEKMCSQKKMCSRQNQHSQRMWQVHIRTIHTKV